MYAKFHACRQICTIFPLRAWTKLFFLQFLAIPTFIVITKCDMLPEDDLIHILSKVKQELSEHLGLGGLGERIHATSLYCDKVTPKLRRSHKIDEVMCEIWDQILRPEFARLVKKGFFT